MNAATASSSSRWCGASCARSTRARRSGCSGTCQPARADGRLRARLQVLLKVARTSPTTRCSCWSGLIVWVFFSQALLAAAPSLVLNAPLVRKVRFPRETIPASVATVQLVTFLVMLALLLPVALVVRDSARPGAAAAPADRGAPVLPGARPVAGWSRAARPLPRRRAGARARRCCRGSSSRRSSCRSTTSPASTTTSGSATCSSGATRSRRSSTSVRDDPVRRARRRRRGAPAYVAGAGAGALGARGAACSGGWSATWRWCCERSGRARSCSSRRRARSGSCTSARAR